MGGMFELAGTQSPRQAEFDCRLAAAFTKIGELTVRLVELNADAKELHRLITDIQERLDRASAPRYYPPTEGTA